MPEEIPNGPKLLNDVHTFLGRFIAYPSDNARVAQRSGSRTPTLWMPGTRRRGSRFFRPSLVGKKRPLEVRSFSSPVPSRPSTSLLHISSQSRRWTGPPTILFDEVDTVFGPKAKDNEEIRGLLNAGHRRGAVAGRCVQGKGDRDRGDPGLLRWSLWPAWAVCPTRSSRAP